MSDSTRDDDCRDRQPDLLERLGLIPGPEGDDCFGEAMEFGPDAGTAAVLLPHVQRGWEMTAQELVYQRERRLFAERRAIDLMDQVQVTRRTLRWLIDNHDESDVGDEYARVLAAAGVWLDGQVEG